METLKLIASSMLAIVVLIPLVIAALQPIIYPKADPDHPEHDTN